MTIELVDLEELGEAALLVFQDGVARSRENPDFDFSKIVDRLIGKVEFAYGLAAKLAHREPTVEGTAAIWSKMVSICDDIARQVLQLETNYPAGKASYDRILDFRNAAEKRRELHS